MPGLLKKIRVSVLLACGLFFCSSAVFAQKNAVENWKRKDTVIFRYPMDIPREISGSFAELRSTHFHGGTDFRTQQREGIKVYAIAPGYIIRAEVSKTGYGKCLYVKHSNGMVSVYAHLSKFGPGIQNKIKRAQKQSGKEEVRLTDLHVKVPAKKPIARSGNSGSSGGPHLHLEIRRDSIRLNPSLWGLPVEDTVAPELYYVAVYEDLPSETFSKKALPTEAVLPENLLMDAPRYDFLMKKALDDEKALPETRTDARATYYKTEELPDTIQVQGPCAFGLCALDLIQNMPFHYGLYELEFLVEPLAASDKSAHFDTLAYYRLDELSPSLYSGIRYHIDEHFYRTTKKRLEKGWTHPGQNVTPYSVLNNRGVFAPPRNGFYRLQINARDFGGNQSSINLILSYICKDSL